MPSIRAHAASQEHGLNGQPTRPGQAASSCVPTRLLDALKRVACVGDSITYGNGSHVGKMERPREGNYPIELQQLLLTFVAAKGNLCQKEDLLKGGRRLVKVMNFGHSGRTLQDGFKQSFRNSSIHGQAIRSDPSLVLLMMGTNDSKPRHWRGVEAFRAALLSMATEFASLATQPIVILLTPPPAFFDPRKLLVSTGAEQALQTGLKYLGKINNSRIRDEIVPIFREAPAMLGPEFMVIDVYSMFEQRMGDLMHAAVAAEKVVSDRSHRQGKKDGALVMTGASRIAEYFHDGIHPTRKCHDLIASWVMEKLVTIFDPTTPSS